MLFWSKMVLLDIFGTLMVMGNSAQWGNCWVLFAPRHSHQNCDPQRVVPFATSTMIFSKDFD